MRDYPPKQRPTPKQFRARRSLVLVWLGVLACLFLMSDRSRGQTTAAPETLQAAYLFKFAKYVTWPVAKFADQNSPINVGFLGKTPVRIKLEESVKNKTVEGRKIVITQSDNIEDLHACHIVYIPLTESARLLTALKTLKDKPLLTIGENRDFLDKGGMIRIVIEDESMQFDVHLPQVQKAGLILDPNMLSCARKVLRAKP